MKPSNGMASSLPLEHRTRIINKLAREISGIVAQPEIRERFYSQGIEPASATPEQFALYIKTTVTKYAKNHRRARPQDGLRCSLDLRPCAVT
jgi:tripartite-type tricarboxylate transporter receptor subunit TctC